ncbi:MAG: cytochrome C oxidase subunit IV family protein [Phycisphaerales bacterium]
MSDTQAQAFDPLDPHGSNHAEGHEGHVIVGWKTQLTVLIALLILTALTVNVAQAEVLIMDALDITLPHWVNIVGAMLIATVKATLVCMFFMQLKYDKPLNSIVFGFCLFCVFLFLFFAILDLTHRDTIRPEKAQVIVPGGTGVGLNQTVQDGTWSAGIGPRPTINNQPITDFRFEQTLVNKYNGDAEKMWASYYAKQDHPHRHELDSENYFHALGFDHADEPSTDDRSRPRYGTTPDLFAERAALHDDHHAEDDHAGEDPSTNDTGDEEPAADNGN